MGVSPDEVGNDSPSFPFQGERGCCEGSSVVTMCIGGREGERGGGDESGEEGISKGSGGDGERSAVKAAILLRFPSLRATPFFAEGLSNSSNVGSRCNLFPKWPVCGLGVEAAAGDDK